MDPADLIKMMNDFLTPMTSCVLNNRGTIDKYMGDAMMAFWNAPLDDPDHTRHASISALQMLDALKVVNDNLRSQAEKNKKPFMELRAGIGIHAGRCSVGNMGSKQRFAYSALGDTVNLASRMESQTKGYGISVMLSEDIARKIPDFAVIEIDLLVVKGRTAPMRVYTLLGDAAYAATPAFIGFSALHKRALEAYRERKWEEALTLFDQCREAQPGLASLYSLYRQRIMDFKANPPPADWQGVWVAKEK
jgi:adenylate cyclase